MTYFLEETVEINMDDVSGVCVQEYVFAMPITQPSYREKSTRTKRCKTYPRIKPTMDITAAVRP